jgi:hypothetical protein
MDIYSITKVLPTGSMPVDTGSNFWRRLKDPPSDGGLPEITNEEIFWCPIKGRGTGDAIHYRGPGKNVNEMSDDAVVGADRIDNHDPKDPFNYVRKSGDVQNTMPGTATPAGAVLMD